MKNRTTPGTYLGSEEHKTNLQRARDKTRIPVNCSFCGASYSLGQIKKHTIACYLNPTNKKLCVVCDDPIKNYKDNVTCGYSCSNRHFRTGENHVNWKPEAYRSTCFLHHKKECVICGEALIVEVHHLDEDKNNNDPSNLIPLCPTHHQYWHSKHRAVVEEQVRLYLKNWSSLR